ncbi:GATA transcription factor 5-like [Asparagus officinalis]|uniref:GATA transcription factor 5-like n=1 Tax=Asparagus officinalis TaxID=4686 RepID=UPI00098DE63A|nr:GATA transcription factor 5-like [Asparagus officinalis]
MNEDDHRHVYMMSEGVLGNVEEFFDFSSDGGDNYCYNYCDNNAQISAANSHGEEGCGVTPTSEENEINNEANAGEKDWVTSFFDPQFDIDIPATFVPVNDFIDNDESVFGPLSPKSVLDEPIIISLNQEGPSSSSISRPPIRRMPTKPIPARPRTKRARRPASVRFTAPVISPSVEGPPAIPAFLDATEGPMKIHPVRKMKKEAPRVDDHPDGILPLRKCKHCGVSKTPQWRAGPTGPKTLCNACGVRYKSGRLFPEASLGWRISLRIDVFRLVSDNQASEALGSRGGGGGSGGGSGGVGIGVGIEVEKELSCPRERKEEI